MFSFYIDGWVFTMASVQVEHVELKGEEKGDQAERRRGYDSTCCCDGDDFGGDGDSSELNQFLNAVSGTIR